MKKVQLCLTILTAILLISAAPAMAQVRLGAVVDVNFADMSTDDAEFNENLKTYMRLGVGGVLEYGINEKLAFVTEPMLLGKGVKGEDSEGDTTASLKLKLSYFELPLLAKYSFGEKNAIRPYLLGGPTIGFKTGAKAVMEGLDDEGGESTEDISEDVKSTDLGFGFGGGVSMPVSSGRAFAEVQYVLGLVSVDKDDEDSAKNKGFQLRFGVTFPIGSK
jgi:hypothetical protein